MHLRSTLGMATVLSCILLGSALQAQQAAQPGLKPSTESLQIQINALREGQEKLQRDLDELKALLKERPPRVETAAMAKPLDLVTVNVTGEPFKGSASARVAILEYSDFDCSFCATYATQIYPLLDHAYIQAGKVKYFFRDFPGPDHPGALFKAKVARCAGDQDRFWEAHDHLFRNQKPLDGPGMGLFIQNLRLDEARFRACISSNQYIEAIQRSANTATRMRINGTPAFLLGTLSEDGSFLTAKKIFLGAESYGQFREALDTLLKASEAPAPPKAAN